ncbi:MAG: ATP-binding protein, partial [Muribaculaceae bacterium]|nr:ATP-binding protein [Muribaculaceae bacterium]
LNSENYSEEDGLKRKLYSIFEEYEKKYNITDIKDSPALRLEKIIREIHEQTGSQVVILVDEYDKPLLETEDNLKLFEKNQRILKSVFGLLKSMDRYIHFALLTGVARFNKVSIFSDMNNLKDISMLDKFSNIGGMTHEELVSYFQPGIDAFARNIETTYQEALEKLKEYYDGYQFTPRGDRLYNPFSVLNALSDERLDRYWFQTGTPSFLIRRIKNAKISLFTLNDAKSFKSGLVAVGVEDPNPIPILFQTGYLTIKHAEGERYYLHFPNYEVETGFAEQLLPVYAPQLNDLNGDFSIWEFQDDLASGDPEHFMKRLQTMIKNVPYESHNELFYQNIVYILFTLSGADTKLEEHSNRGRTDLIVRTAGYIYIFEFKYNGTAEEAIARIHDRDYAGRFAMDSRPIFLIGANFSSSERGLEKWII